jgi:TubC N-terminal docking domain
MNLSELLAELQCRGVSLVRDDNEVRCEGRGSPLPPELLQELQDHRAELLESLAQCGWYKAPLAGPASDYWRVVHDAGVSYLCSASCALKAWPWRMEVGDDNRDSGPSHYSPPLPGRGH